MISNFKGEHAFLSNFYRAPVVIDGIEFPTSEHAFQGLKSGDHKEAQRIAKLCTPAQAKQAGRLTTMRKDWDEVKYSVMERVVREKFRQNPELADLLLATGTHQLVEGNHWHDQTWGNCTCGQHEGTEGQNFLGKILMQVRSEITVGV